MSIIKKPNRPYEEDTIHDVRNATITLRDLSLNTMMFNDAILLTHVIAWLFYLIELEQYINNLESSKK